MALGICAAVFIAFSPVLSNAFVNWDDDANFLDNMAWRGLGWENLRWMFTSLHMGHYIPLTWVSMGLDYELWGLNPFGYHFTALLLHTANAVLFFFCVNRLFAAAAVGASSRRRAIAALLAALFFAIHPLRVESVAWATARRDLVSGLFALSSLLYYLRYARDSRPGYYAASLVLFACATLSRESTAALPFVFLVLDVYPLRRLLKKHSWQERKTVLMEKMPFFAVGAAAALMAVIATKQLDCLESLADSDVYRRVGLSVYSMAFYLWKTALPLNFSHLYAIPPGFSITSFAALASAVFLLALFYAAWRLRRKYPGFKIALFAYFVFILPSAGVAATISLAYDRFSYLSCLGLAALFGSAFITVARAAGQHVALVFFSVILLVLGMRSFDQTEVWRDNISLWNNAVKNGQPHFRAQALSA
ncbi:MAG TPA: hypothetical protein PLL10_09280, partial [Elusimicrobiales bacterium]|nr:hypothetical protein [Elusimicrobiales bacterium]